MEDHIGQAGGNIVNGIFANQIHIAVADIDVALLVHLAEIAQLDIVALFLCGQMKRCFRLVQTVLGIIRHIRDHKGHTVFFKVFQDIQNLFLADGECFIIPVSPAVISLAECQTSAAGIFPGQGQNRIGGNLQDNRIAGADALLLFLIPGQSKGRDTCRCQNNNQYDYALIPFHSASSSYLQSRKCRCPDRPAGKRRSSAASG